MRVAHFDTPVVVLRLDHHGALGVMRSLGRLGIAVYGVHARADAPALGSRYARGGFVWDLDEEPAARSVERLRAIALELGGRPILLPTNDETALFVAENAALLRDSFRFPECAPDLVRRLYDKHEMHLLARAFDVPTAETTFPERREEVLAFAARCRFPVVLKASDGISVARRSGSKTVIARDADELLAWWDKMAGPLEPAQPDLMLQEYIPGGVDAQWMFNGYFDAASECLFGVTGRKLRQNPAYTGMSSLAECVRNDEVDALTRRFMQAVGYRGILDIGYRFDARDGRYKVLDVNPRLGATFRLFVGEDGLDVARAMYLHLTGQAIPASRAREGRRWVVEDLDLPSSVRYFRDGALSPRGFLRSFRGVEEAGWFAADDPRPFVEMCGRVVGRAARKAGKLVGLSAPTPHPSTTHTDEVARHFARVAGDWQRVYDPGDERLEAIAYRERARTALGWVDALSLPERARVLEIGCGAGVSAIELARRGFRVHAVDIAEEMIALATRSAEDAGVPFTAEVGDAQALALGDGSFELVVALGLLPWLRSEARGLGEMARVLKPGGFLITTADHRAPLHRLLDPRKTPSLAPLRAGVKRLLGRGSPSEPVQAKQHDPGMVDALLRAAGLEKVSASAIGFGPFSLFGRRLFSPRTDVRLQRRLQELAHRQWPLVRSTGAHYVVLARKPAA